LVPATEIPVIVSAAVPGFDSVTVCDGVVTPTAPVKVSDVGARTACGVGAAVPVPVSVAVCGEPAALSATLIVAVNVVAEAGVNVTEMVQFALAASVVPQLLVWEKSLGFAPAIEMPVIVNAAFPGFDSVIVCAAVVVPVVLVKVSAVGARTACAAVPVPVSVAVCGELVALSATEMLAERAPALPGVNVTEIVQLAPAASELPQLFVCAKLLALVPVTVMPVIVSAAVPGFDSIRVCAAVVVPTGVGANVKLVGASTACGVPVAVPDRVRVCVV